MPGEFELEGRVPPWGRSASEYEAFFGLSDLSPGTRVLDCGGGPASFAAEWGARGRFVVSADPVYAQPAAQTIAGFEWTAARMLEGMRRARDRFVWGIYANPEAVIERRRRAVEAFGTDMALLHRAGRYVAASLPDLPFADGCFDVVLCSHLLFLYSHEFSLEAHIAALREMIRVGNQVRVFPLLNMDGEPSPHVEPAVQAVRDCARAEIVPVEFEFQRGASKMLRITRLGA